MLLWLLFFPFLLEISSSFSSKVTLTDPNGGYFYSPEYHSDYPNDLSTTYSISAPDGYYIRITFLVFHTEQNYDTLTIYDGDSSDSKLLARLSGSRSGTVLVTSGNNVYMDFETDLAVNDRGFYAKYEVFLVGTNPQDLHGCPQSNYESAQFLGITSPNWPRNYTELLDCGYHIKVDPGYTIHLMIEAFQTEHFDYLRIYDGPNADANPIAELRDSPATPIDFTSTTNEMYMFFSTDLLYTDIGFAGVFWPVSADKSKAKLSKGNPIKETVPKIFDSPKISSLFHLRPARHLLIP
ncbi:unnamed protein product, partial [Mesorhabditis belari]|uniref:CUB domain-containing protein n=1 Tax=Mesorhabditis belari TaxID=2138241 RepID=A0AAF3F397_9BILA